MGIFVGDPFFNIRIETTKMDQGNLSIGNDVEDEDNIVLIDSSDEHQFIWECVYIVVRV